jgi:hypothetical protein
MNDGIVFIIVGPAVIIRGAGAASVIVDHAPPSGDSSSN